jgi:hypothetical protein
MPCDPDRSFMATFDADPRRAAVYDAPSGNVKIERIAPLGGIIASQ